MEKEGGESHSVLKDVVIAAVELSEMNGLTFTNKLQEILPVVYVIVSSRSGVYARAAYDAGAEPRLQRL